MGFWSFLILVVLILAGAWFYRRLQDLEKDLRREMEADAAAGRTEKTVVGNGDVLPPNGSTVSPVDEPVAREPEDLAGRVSDLVAAEPGMRQTDFYNHMPDVPRKALQELLRNMEHEGGLRREKDRGSYKLYPA